MSSKGSFNVYLTDTEYDFVRRGAEDLGTTNAYVIRLILRDFLGLPIGGSGRSEIAVLTELATPHVGNLTPRI